MNIRRLKSAESVNEKTPAKTYNTEFPIVGIGASAGGLEALEQFFGNMPKDSGMAFVVIQHLSPTDESFLTELLQRVTQLKVQQVTDGLRIKPNCVYVIPPNKSLSFLNGVLHLFALVESHGKDLPINTFFSSLAFDRKEKSIGIILSGMGSDGCLGVKAIKEENGIVLVQDPASAGYDGMPRSAIKAVIVDIVAAASELPAKLIDFLKYIPLVNIDFPIDIENNSNLDKIITLLREQTGNDFSLYKKNTLLRRIERRRVIQRMDNTNTYVSFLQENPKEVETLFKELLIGITSFFRNSAVWEMLKESVLPALINELPEGYVMRAWVTGCSTGEEAYSLAIVFSEALEKAKKNKNLFLQIFATDIEQDAIEIARKGVYYSNIVADVSPDRISRFFTPEVDGYRVKTLIREMVTFATHNIIKDPPFTRLNILTCRNMLIYMEPELQIKLYAKFNYILNPGGIMILGIAESLRNQKKGFDEVEPKLKIFKRTVTPLKPELHDFASYFDSPKAVTTEFKIPPKSNENIHILADQILLQRFTPASVLVNNKGDIVYITGKTGKYLEPVAGKANWNIYAMARVGLRQVLPGALRKAFQSFDPVIEQNIKVETNGGTNFVDITVQYIEFPDSISGMVMVVFTDVPVVGDHSMGNPTIGKLSSIKQQKELEIELHRSYPDIQILREEMQTSQEELKSTIEELQSTNENLIISKEEMQSINEEIQAVNEELKSKVNGYDQSSDDIKNLLNSTKIATLFLDKELNIRRFTDNIVIIVKLRSGDIGRPFTDLVTDLEYPEIERHARQVLETLSFVETAVATHDSRWFNVRIMPYRTFDDHIDGLVMTFTDITIAKKLEIELKEANEALQIKEKALTISEARYRRFFESAKDGILIIDAETDTKYFFKRYLK